jgi:putative MATE family efflux protein
MTRSTQHVAHKELGSAPIPGLLFKLSVPSILGLLALTLCQLIDTIFIGRCIGVQGIGGIAVVMPVILLFSSVGRGLGVGGSSIITRSNGANDHASANTTLSLLVLLCVIFSVVLATAGLLLTKPLLHFFGSQAQLFSHSQDYFQLLLPGLPFLCFAMLSNNVIRAEGNARTAMLVMVIPAVINVVLDPLFILWCGWGMKGAAAATSIAYLCSGCFACHYFCSHRSSLKFEFGPSVINGPLLKKILTLALTPIACQSSTAVLTIVMNKTLFAFGGEVAMATYGIVQRLHIFIMFPVIGLSQGFIPICGYNHGAGATSRVRILIQHALKAAVATGSFIALLLLLFNQQLASIFTLDPSLIHQSGFAICMVVLMLPLVAIQLICSAYFQTLGQALPTLLLNLLRQGLVLIPLVLILPHFLGLRGVWYAFPISNFLACGISLLLVLPHWRQLETPATLTN